MKHLAGDLSTPLSILFQRLFDAGITPIEWKHGVISPIYKGGDRSLASNYRPITLLSVISKLMEKVVADELMAHFEQNDLLFPGQHGFRRQRSCTTNLLSCLSQWTSIADSGRGIDVLYLDFSKAFDRVNHDLLLLKLRHYGVHGNLLRWLTSFLDERTISVRVQNSKSTPAKISCGVPQGSVLGPRLFLIFINDLPLYLKSEIILYADDAKVWRKVHCRNDEQVLQDDLTRVYDWSVQNQLPLNESKCHVISINHRGKFECRINGQTLKRT